MSDEDVTESLEGTYGGPPVSVAYWVDAPMAQLRVVDPNGLSSEVPAAIVRQLAGSGVPQEPPSELWFHSSQSVNNAAVLLTVAGSRVVVILGPRPRQGTRWFWFWLVGGPVTIGIAIFAVAELVRPRYEPEGTVHPRGGRGPLVWPRGLRSRGILLSFAGGALLLLLTNLSPIWFLRG